MSEIKIVGYTSIVLNPSGSSSLEQLALKGLSCMIKWMSYFSGVVFY